MKGHRPASSSLRPTAVTISGYRPITKARSHYRGVFTWDPGMDLRLHKGTCPRDPNQNSDNPVKYNRKARIHVSLKCDKLMEQEFVYKRKRLKQEEEVETLFLVVQGFREKCFWENFCFEFGNSSWSNGKSHSLSYGSVLWGGGPGPCFRRLRAGERPPETHSGSHAAFLSWICTLLQLQQSVKAGVSEDVATQQLKDAQCFNNKD